MELLLREHFFWPCYTQHILKLSNIKKVKNNKFKASREREQKACCVAEPQQNLLTRH